jgi:hypothetical protein
MSLDYATLEILRRQHAAWHLLLAEHAALIASFLHKHHLTVESSDNREQDMRKRL